MPPLQEISDPQRITLSPAALEELNREYDGEADTAYLRAIIDADNILIRNTLAGIEHSDLDISSVERKIRYSVGQAILPTKLSGCPPRECIPLMKQAIMDHLQDNRRFPSAGDRLRQLLHENGLSYEDSFPNLINDIRQYDLIQQQAQVRHDQNNLLHTMALSNALHTSTPLSCTSFKSERLTNPKHAVELADRHRQLNRAREIAHAILAWKEKGDVEPLQIIRQKVENFGAFLQDYTEQDEACRLADQKHWYIYRGKGALYNKETDIREPRRPLSDIQVHLTLDGEPYFSYPCIPRMENLFQDYPSLRRISNDHGEDVLIHGAEEVLQKLLEYPSIGGCVADICVIDDAARLGVAGKNRNVCCDGIRQDHPDVQYLIAEVFRIRGVIWNGQTYLVDEITNARSAFMHAFSKKQHTIFGWQRKGDRITVNVPPWGEVTLLVDWDVYIHDLHKQAA